MRIHGRGFAVILLMLCGIAVLSAAQTATVPSQPTSEEARIKALEERIILLEGQVRMLQQQQAQSATAATPASVAAPAVTAPPQAAGTPVGGGPEQAGQLPVYGGAAAASKALNPDISVIGDFIGAVGHNPFTTTPALEMHESEVGFQSIIDPYARGDFFLSFGEEGVGLEEGYITFTALPAHFVVRGGKMRAAFGKVNTFHNHVLSWVDRPLVTENLVGGEEGISDAGFSVNRILPAPKGLFLEGTGQVFRGDTPGVFQSSRRSDVSAVAHLRGYRDISDSTNIDLGVSYARGHNDLGSGFLTQLYGVDATVRWKPLRRAIYRSFLARSEFIWSRREQLLHEQRAFGFYVSGDYQFARRWTAGARYDRSGRARDAALTDTGASLVLTYRPSEFSQLRGQYRLTRYAEHFDAHELLLQLQFALGAHGAHPF